eukprot:558146-Hanusia_phi.AAC.1
MQRKTILTGDVETSLQFLSAIGSSQRDKFVTSASKLDNIRLALELFELKTVVSKITSHPRVRRFLSLAESGFDQGCHVLPSVQKCLSLCQSLTSCIISSLMAAGCYDLAMYMMCNGDHKEEQQSGRAKERKPSVSAVHVSAAAAVSASPSTSAATVIAASANNREIERLWDQQREFSIRLRCLQGFLQSFLPVTPDWKHPFTLQWNDPAKVVDFARQMKQQKEKLQALGFSVDLIDYLAMQECLKCLRFDCHAALSLSCVDPSWHLDSLKLLSNLGSYAEKICISSLQTMPSGRAKPSAQSYYLRISQRLAACLVLHNSSRQEEMGC